jgi:hypothetical protein
MSRSLANTIKAENLPVTSREQIHAWLEGEHTQVLHLDNLVNKLQPIEVGYILQEVEARGIKVQLAYVQGAISLQGANFDRLCRFLATPSLWTVNMGELMFSGPQLKNLKGVLENSNVTHMFYELPHGALKDRFREIIRLNRAKHAMWELSEDHAQNFVIMQSLKNWYNPQVRRLE